MPELLQFDPTSEDAANSPLSVMNTSYIVTAHDYPAPPLQVTYASSIDTEGETPASKRYGNRTVSLTLEMTDATGALLRALQAKVAKIAREGGTLKRTLATGQVIVFDLVSAEQFAPTFDVSYYSGNLVKVDLEFAAKPFGRGTPVTLSAHTESTLPCLVFTETGITGDVPALGKLVITEAQAVDQAFVMWGIQSKNYSSSADAALFYQAEGRTAMGGSAAAAGPSGASGAGSNVMRNSTLASSHQAVLSTQATGGGNHLAHVGDFNVWARVQAPVTNVGDVTVAMEWAEGDFRRWTRTPDQLLYYWRRGKWLLVHLGQVHLSQVAQGTQQWEARILAKSTVASVDRIDIDCLFLVPNTEGSGQAQSLANVASPTSFVARDEFDQSAGTFTGKTAPVGGTWAGAGDTDDFVSQGPGISTVTRSVVGDTFPGRIAIAGSSTYTNVAVQITAQDAAVISGGGAGQNYGVVARYTDVNNHMWAQFFQFADGLMGVVVEKRIAGTRTVLWSPGADRTFTANTDYTIRLVVDAAGRWFVFLDNSSAPVAQGEDSSLATGGTLATGMVGFIDYANGTPTSGTHVRSYNDFKAWVPVSDAAMYASQSLEVRHDRVIREDSAGAVWQAPSKYEGSYLRIPPAGAEGRTLRVFVKASRSDPATMADSGIDDITGTLTYVPRYLVIP